MTTKKDLVEAHAFSRRRLVTAFLSGAPGGREVEPNRPGRTILGGVALAVLLLAAGAVASVLAPRAASDWDNQGLVVTESGSRYVVTQDGGDLWPVTNLTSAQLILGLEPHTTVVSADTVDKRTPRPPIGILGAPESLPTTDHFIETGWTACTAAGRGVSVGLSASPGVAETSGAGFLVRTPDGTRWLIAEATSSDTTQVRAYRYRLPDNPALAQSLFRDGEQVPPEVDVSADWVDLFPAGTALGAEGFDDDGYGEPSKLAGQSGVPSSVRTGDLMTYQGRSYLVRRDGWVELSPFAAAVYANTPVHGTLPAAPVALDRLPSLASSETSMPATRWPRNQLTALLGTACARLDAGAGAAATVRLTRPASDASDAS
ncbi:MAG: type VII secretion protein EccB, partial [Nocardioides sp.]|uniref:type VII secretion protein EccB n=1 Tax=Nocardioides sp. TaxID=35761 RepID=UPI0039E55DC1